jgi:metallo-beta-lactamase family protein
MKIKFLGAASGIVTGSSYVLTSGSGTSILIDLGMFQGVEKIEALNYEPFDCDGHSLAGVVLTHAHLDHCGRLPIILPLGFSGEIWTTPATRDLAELSLFDTAKIALQDDKPVLFNKELVEETVNRFHTVEYHTPFTIGDFTITMRDAGHILGSASLEIVDSHPNSAISKIVFSGDLGNSPEELARATETFSQADAVVMESTYGDRLHPSGDPRTAIQSEINTIETTGGTLLIPAFSLERTQEILHIIKHLKLSGTIAATTPIYLDSPMGKKATNIYARYPTLFNTHIQSEWSTGSPFTFPNLVVIEHREQTEALMTQSGPQVIIAGSGMMTGGKILSHAAHFLPIPTTRLLLVGYQGEETLGRTLLEGSKNITIDKRNVPVAATITDMPFLSSHADQSQLISWLKNIQSVQKLIITHGEDAPRAALAQKVSADLGITDITLPVLHQEVIL